MKTKLKIIVFIVCCIFIVGCCQDVVDTVKVGKRSPDLNRNHEIFTGPPVIYDLICIDNVEYLFGRYGDRGIALAPHFKSDGSLYLCSNNEMVK